MKSHYDFSIDSTQFLNERGELIREMPESVDEQKLVEFYRWMVRVRVFDQKAIALQRTGQLGTYPSSLGQEAIGVAIGMAMSEDDVLVPGYRDHAAQFLRGVEMKDVLLYWGGDERGNDSGCFSGGGNFEQGRNRSGSN